MTLELNVDELRKQSAIYSLNQNDKLLYYHTAINEACFELAKENPALLTRNPKCSNLPLPN